jgi:hypothetical protein
MTIATHQTITVGKFLVSPSSRVTDTGDFSASISIRSGRGAASHDRVFRFSPRFQTQEGALAYAMAEGRNLIRQQYAA